MLRTQRCTELSFCGGGGGEGERSIQRVVGLPGNLECW